MAVTLPDDTVDRSLASIKRYFKEQREEEISSLATGATPRAERSANE